MHRGSCARECSRNSNNSASHFANFWICRLLPSLYICGSKDSSILCNHDYALRTEEYIAEGFKYTYLEVDCGHDLTSPSCSEHEKVYAAIIAHIQDAMIVAAIT